MQEQSRRKSRRLNYNEEHEVLVGGGAQCAGDYGQRAGYHSEKVTTVIIHVITCTAGDIPTVVV